MLFAVAVIAPEGFGLDLLDTAKSAFRRHAALAPVGPCTRLASSFLPMQHHDNLKRIVIKNASANLLRLVGAGIVALLLPPFLVRMLPKDVYGAWALLLQLTLYVGYLDFGIQTAVARFVAHTTELGDFEQRDGIVSTALIMLSGAAILGVLLTIVLVLR